MFALRCRVMDEAVTRIDAPCRVCGGLTLSDWTLGPRGERVAVPGSERCATPEQHRPDEH